jgi:hypothetical protein
MRWCTSDGWGVEVICMSLTPDRHDGDSLRVTHHGYWIAYARSVAELERWIELADLAEETLGRQRANLSAVAGSCRGWKYTEPQPGSRQRIIRWPLPRGCAFRAGSHWHGRHDTLGRVFGADRLTVDHVPPTDRMSRTPRPGKETGVKPATAPPDPPLGH